MMLKKCIILLPLIYNDQTEITPAIINDILKEIERRFDGYTIEGTVTGAYKMDDGSVAHDKSTKVVIAVDPTKVDELKKLVAKFAGKLKQESLYFEVTDTDVELIRPEQEMGES